MPRDLVVRARNCRAMNGVATIGPVTARCGIGRGGLTRFKREGDGKTPIGRWVILQVLYRLDRVRGFYNSGALRGARPINQNDGWCDAIGDNNYNRPVRHPYRASAERMWRDDHLYDVVVILGHNQRPRVQGGGSAIFLHVAKTNAASPGANPIAGSAGCVTLQRRDLAIVLKLLRPGSAVRVVG